MILLTLNKLITNIAIKALLLLYSLSSKSFLKKILKIPKLLFIISRENIKQTPNISLKKPETKYHIFATSHLF